ncbi:MAG: hypothetical protein HRU20_29880 [Pseudomonadales bacterium]|nr:hypothetical protein [Pseudomonadales bacterium]
MPIKKSVSLLILLFIITACIESRLEDQDTAFILQKNRAEVRGNEIELIQLYASSTLSIEKHHLVAVDHQADQVIIEDDDDGKVYGMTITDESTILQQLNAGDEIDIEILQTLSVELIMYTELIADHAFVKNPEWQEKSASDKSSRLQKKRLIYTIESIDRNNGSFSLKDSDAKVREFIAENPFHLNNASTGDEVVVTFTEIPTLLIP